MFNDSLKYLYSFFGYKSFRGDQEEIIKNIISKKDTLAIMPTGGGKSLCYQIPSLCFNGLTIVVSPLISLMKDQVDTLLKTGIPCDYINSTLSSYDIKTVFYKLKKGNLRLLYVSPERLHSKDFLEAISNIHISFIAIDEAHCISMWGNSFRKSYKSISTFINNLKHRPVVAAFTATATKKVEDDIIESLNLISPKVFKSTFNRNNLTINIKKTSSKLNYVLKFLKKHQNEFGIIYASTQIEVDKLFNMFLNMGLKCGRYHGGLLKGEKDSTQERFLNGDIMFIIATNAFGMGIDKSNIRFVIHYNMPKTIEDYYQEIGRAGRDGKPSSCILLFSSDDIKTNNHLIESGCSNDTLKSLEYKKLESIINMVHLKSCIRKYILSYFGEDVSYSNCNNCSICINQNENSSFLGFLEKKLRKLKIH